MTRQEVRVVVLVGVGLDDSGMPRRMERRRVGSSVTWRARTRGTREEGGWAVTRVRGRVIRRAG